MSYNNNQKSLASKNWYIILGKVGYEKALKLLKAKYNRFVIFDYGRKTIQGIKTLQKDNHPTGLQVHHDYELNLSDICKDYSGYGIYCPKINYCTNLTYCNIFEHYVLHCLINVTKKVKVSEEEMFAELRPDLSKSELKAILNCKHTRMLTKKADLKFAGWTGIYKIITNIYKAHYQNMSVHPYVEKYMDGLTDEDYQDFTAFGEQLPHKFRKDQVELDEWFNNKNFNNQSRHYSLNESKKELAIQFKTINLPNLLNNTHHLMSNKNFCTKKHGLSQIFTNAFNANVLKKFIKRDSRLFNTIYNFCNDYPWLKKMAFESQNDPITFIQFIREVSGLIQGFPPIRQLCRNDIISFAVILPILQKNPDITLHCDNIYRYIKDNNLPYSPFGDARYKKLIGTKNYLMVGNEATKNRINNCKKLNLDFNKK